MSTKTANAKYAHLYKKELEGKMLIKKRNGKVLSAFMIGFFLDCEERENVYEVYSSYTLAHGLCFLKLSEIKKLADGKVLTRKFRNGDIIELYVKRINECTL